MTDRQGQGAPRGPVRTGRRGPAGARTGAGDAPLTPWRRAGVAVIAAALGLSVVLALGGTQTPVAPPGPDGPDPTARPAPTATAATPADTTVPVIAAPEPALTTEAEWPARISIPDPGIPVDDLKLRIYRNGEDILLVKVKELETTRKVPLKRGENRIEVALVTPEGEGPRSAPVFITLDTQPPRIDVDAPRDGAIVTTTLVEVRGTSEPGLEILVRNTTNGAEQRVTTADDGSFGLEIRAGTGQNRIVLSATDAAGNRREETLVITVGTGEGQATLKVTPGTVRLAELPTTVTIRAEVRDVDGKPADGVIVDFSITIPGLETEVWEATTDPDGLATWPDVVIPRQGASAGEGLVTAVVELGDGTPAIQVARTLRVE
ncbi:MAG: hypothetical protein ACKOTZ_10735 [Chloroflexota bacterium]